MAWRELDAWPLRIGTIVGARAGMGSGEGGPARRWQPTRRFDLSAWRELTPGDPAGVSAIDRVNLSADGSAYVYSVRRQLSNVAMMTGLQD